MNNEEKNQVNPEYVNAPYHCSIIDDKWGRIEVCEAEPEECDIWLRCGPLEPRAFQKVWTSFSRWNRIEIDLEPFRKYLPPTMLIPPWTTKPPTIDGWYWYQWESGDCSIVRIRGGYVFQSNSEIRWRLKGFPESRWSGPIPEPPKI